MENQLFVSPLKSLNLGLISGEKLDGHRGTWTRCLGDKECRNEAHKTQTEKFKEKTDKRQGGLLLRIRSETPSEIIFSKKIKKNSK